MPKNKLFTLGYFRMRLKERGIKSKVIIDMFPDGDDNRYWLLSIHETHRIICQCYVNKNNGEYWFEFSDGHRMIHMPYTIKTDSMNVILEFINKKMEQYRDANPVAQSRPDTGPSVSDKPSSE